MAGELLDKRGLRSTEKHGVSAFSFHISTILCPQAVPCIPQPQIQPSTDRHWGWIASKYVQSVFFFLMRFSKHSVLHGSCTMCMVSCVQKRRCALFLGRNGRDQVHRQRRWASEILLPEKKCSPGMSLSFLDFPLKWSGKCSAQQISK